MRKSRRTGDWKDISLEGIFGDIFGELLIIDNLNIRDIYIYFKGLGVNHQNICGVVLYKIS